MTSMISYFNCSIINSSDNGSPIVTQTSLNLSSPILSNLKDYYGSIIRFNVSQFMIPVSYFKVQTPVNNINLGVYSFTMSYNGTFSDQTYLVWIPSNNTASIPSTGTTTQPASNYYFIYSYQHMIDIMNTALIACYADLVSKTVGLQANEYPFFTYDSGLQQLILYAPLSFDSNGATPINLFYNTPLNQYLHGFPIQTLSYNSNNGCNYQLLTKSLPTALYAKNKETINNVDFIVINQEASCLSYWNMLRNVSILSNLPINNESMLTNNSALYYSNVITDFTPDLSGPDEALIASKQSLFTATSLYRLFEFKNNTSSISNIDIQIKFSDNDGNQYDLMLFPGMSCSMKFMFIHKDLVKLNA